MSYQPYELVLPDKVETQLFNVAMADGSVWQGRLLDNGQIELVTQIQQPPPSRRQSLRRQAMRRIRSGRLREREQLEGGQVPPEPPIDKNFRQQLASILGDNKFDRQLRGRTKGKLDLGRLPKAAMNQRTVFKLKQARKNKQFNVVLAVDLSGSMQGAPLQAAAETAMFLSKHFEDLQLDLAVIGFDYEARTLKRFDQKLSPSQVATEMLRQLGGATYDIPALKLAYEMVKGRAGQSLVFVITDGGVSNAAESRTLIKANEHIATTIGIGLYADYDIQNSVTLQKPETEIQTKVLNTLRAKISRA